MRRLLPYPGFAGALLLMWLLLSQSVSLGHILLGSLIALLATNAMSALQPESVRIRPSLAIPRLALIVLVDIFRSNLAVGRIILFGKPAHHRSGYLQLPLQLQDRYGLAILAMILTATPGTLWLQYDRSRSVLLLHVLDLVDDQQWIDLIRNRYERLLMEIFE
ncbi:Na+/H+ antiporter subunit E [Sandaracinobacter neustonicus]|uniref:Na+/H+ antiporter subunit E n=1 Tax=Sandaracinobacter neustonicus TaxID=1715348 RepID=A0A501XT40_9SPHN|nr:Na+/H+ antiporter subunit E [Sandaracinobacter neustonicus]TPE63942.1 Na+/H+ antiporter subunit E [Sandaracinobacter neustonicus]